MVVQNMCWYGVEDVLVCDAMIGKQVESCSIFIARPLRRNQRIVERCLSLFSPYVLLYLLCSWGWTINWHWKTCWYVISKSCFQVLNEFKALYSNFILSTEGNWTPSQKWLNGMLNPSYPTVENLVYNLDYSAEFCGVDWSRVTFTIWKQWSLVVLILLNKLYFISLIYWNLRLKLELIFDGQRIYIRTDFWGMNKMLHSTAKDLFFKAVT